MKRFTEKTVFCGLVTACRLADWPTRRSPVFVNATTEGVVRAPSEFSRTVGSPASMTAMHELVVPRSIPRIFAIKSGVGLFVQEKDVWRRPLARAAPDPDILRNVLHTRRLHP